MKRLLAKCILGGFVALVIYASVVDVMFRAILGALVIMGLFLWAASEVLED